MDRLQGLLLQCSGTPTAARDPPEAKDFLRGTPNEMGPLQGLLLLFSGTPTAARDLLEPGTPEGVP